MYGQTAILRHVPASTPPSTSRKRRDRRLEIRLDPELFDLISSEADKYGGASVITRALLRKFARGEVKLTKDDLVEELLSASKRRKLSK
jgi:hypothetical protein